MTELERLKAENERLREVNARLHSALIYMVHAAQFGVEALEPTNDP